MQHINANLQATIGSSLFKHKHKIFYMHQEKNAIVYVKSAVCFLKLFTEHSLQLPWSKELQ